MILETTMGSPVRYITKWKNNQDGKGVFKMVLPWQHASSSISRKSNGRIKPVK